MIQGLLTQRFLRSSAPRSELDKPIRAAEFPSSPPVGAGQKQKSPSLPLEYDLFSRTRSPLPFESLPTETLENVHIRKAATSGASAPAKCHTTGAKSQTWPPTFSRYITASTAPTIARLVQACSRESQLSSDTKKLKIYACHDRTEAFCAKRSSLSGVRTRVARALAYVS